MKTVNQKNGWKFDWKQELNQPQKQVYKLTTEKEPSLIQGLVSLEIKEKDKFIFMYLIENAPFNIGKNKLYQGVCGNLIAFGCKLSVEQGFEGYLAFDSASAANLISKYFSSKEGI